MLRIYRVDKEKQIYSIWNTVTDKFEALNVSKEEAIKCYKNYRRTTLKEARAMVENCLDTNEEYFRYLSCELLEQKDQRIKELEDELTTLRQDYDECYEDVYDRVSEEFKLNNKYDWQMSEASKTIEELQKEIANDKDCENGCYSRILSVVNEIRHYKGENNG